jgi:hypothetical protein
MLFYAIANLHMQLNFMLHSVSYPAVDCIVSIPSYNALLIEGVSFFFLM